MIKLFRNIRKNLLNEGKTSKYFKYAIGEIVLVVIGILIALQINTWNELRKEKNEEKAVLESLFENLKITKQQSENLLLEEENLKKALLLVLGIQNEKSTLDSGAVTNSIFKNAVWDLQSDQPTFNTYANLKNTNKLSLIKNKTINQNFTDIEFRFNKLNDMLEDRLSVHQIRIDDILEKDINFIPLAKSEIPELNLEKEPENNYEEILKIKRIRNLLAMKLSLTQDIITSRKNLDQGIKELILLLESELNQYN
jgi:hypothetical protein